MSDDQLKELISLKTQITQELEKKKAEKHDKGSTFQIHLDEERKKLTVTLRDGDEIQLSIAFNEKGETNWGFRVEFMTDLESENSEDVFAEIIKAARYKKNRTRQRDFLVIAKLMVDAFCS